MKLIIDNWKTSAAALALAAVTVAFLVGRLTYGEYMAAVGTLSALGLALAGDGRHAGQ